MKFFLYAVVFISMFAVSACNVYVQKSPERTSSARAAYGNAVREFKANKKRNQKRKNKARKQAKQKKPGNNNSYWHGRPY